MYKAKLCLGINGSFELGLEEQIRLFKQSGFDGFFAVWGDDLGVCRTEADRLGMIFQSVHAPFLNAAYMWEDSKNSEMAVDELMECVQRTASIEVPIVIMHTYKGFAPSAGPTNAGIENFKRVIEEAARLNVKIAFENTEGEEYLEALMSAFSAYDNVGFCWDTGHELCYNMGKDMIALYGDRLIATHLNDNLGISSFDGKTCWTDDLHLLPFDGANNWNNIAHRLNSCHYDGELTFELTRMSKPDRHDNDKYMKMSIEEYIAECYARACKIAHLKLETL